MNLGRIELEMRMKNERIKEVTREASIYRRGTVM